MSEYRRIDLNDWHKKGEGSYSDYYVSEDESLMLKVFHKDATEENARADYEMADKVVSLGISTAAVHEIVEVDGGFGVIYQNIKNKKSYSRLIVDDPEDMRMFARQFAATAGKLHSTECSTELFESRLDIIRKGIAKAKFIGKYKPELSRLADELEGRTTCLHGDMHTGNLINADGVDYWIDFDRFSYGDPILDIAHMYNIYICCADMKRIQDITHMTQEQLTEFWYCFVEEYYGYTGAEAEKFSDSLDIYNALDLIQRNHSQPGLFSDLITLLLIRPKLKKYFRK